MVDLAFIKNSIKKDVTDFIDTECIEVKVMPPEINFNNLEFETDDGQRETDNNTFNPFDIIVRLLVHYDTTEDYFLRKSELQSYLYDRSSYYLTFEYMPGKRYPVQIKNFEEEIVESDGAVYEVTFSCFKGCSESIETTMSEQNITIQDWQFSQGLIAVDYKYIFRKNSFSVFNLGDFTIDPRKKHDFKIKLAGRSEGDITIFNQTTGEKFVFKGKLSKEQKDELTLEGIHCYKNGVTRNIDTNGELITLVPGENKFVVENVSQVKISFDARFLYKT